jgi:hypothetical protein
MSASFSATLLDIAKANQAAYLAAYEAGFEAGHRAGYAEAMAKSIEIINGAGERGAARDANVCPTCHGRGASAMSDTGTVFYCNCEVTP